jgi:hypothetical protein
MAVLAAGAVSRWRELATDELRERVQQLVAARLDADHPAWRAIRRDPVLTARVRGVLSGMASSISGTRDEHMRRVWIAAARQALEETQPVRPAPVRRAAAMRTQTRHVTAEVDEEHQDLEPAPAPAGEPGSGASADSTSSADSAASTDSADSPDSPDEAAHPTFTSPPPPVTPQSASPRAPIPPMVFSGPLG